MSRWRLLNIAAFMISATIFLTTASQVSAINTCKSPTPTFDPPKLLDTTSRATFTIDVGDNKEPGTWFIETQCSNINAVLVKGPYQQKQATANQDGKTISAYIENITNSSSSLWGIGCEFNPINNPIQVIVKLNNTPFCQASYNVATTASQCQLALSKDKDIKIGDSLTVSGSNLISPGGYTLFVDEDAVDINNNAYGREQLAKGITASVNTPTFTAKPIPQELLTPGNHSVSLRQTNAYYQNIIINQITSQLPDILSQAKSEASFFSPPLCPIIFSVGTKDSPGAVIPGAGVGSITNPCTDPAKCSSGGGKIVPGCSDLNDPTNPNPHPGIATAIGCIHTNPVQFVKDFMTFLIAIGGGFAFLLMLLGAFEMLTSAGNPESLNNGRSRLTNAVIGLLFVIFAVLLMQIIGVDILFKGLPGFGR